MSDQFWLTPAQLNRIKPHFPLSHGVPRIDDLRVISGIIHVIKRGLQWRDAPSDYGPHKTLYNRFVLWSRMGVFDRTFADLAASEGVPEQLQIDATHPDGLIDGKATGQPAKLNDGQRRALARLVESGPIPSIHGVVRWRRKDLAQWIFEEFRISVDETTVGRELKALGFVKISAGPRHKGQNEFAIEDFKKLPRRSGVAPQPAPDQHQDSDLVARRSSGWSKNQTHPARSATGKSAQSAR